MFSSQITCIGGQCDDPRCGIEFIYVGRQRVSLKVITESIAAGSGAYWTVIDGDAVPVSIGKDPSTGAPSVTIAGCIEALS